jgi:hypothetical protein
MQDSKPLAFYSQKLNTGQKQYTTGKQELLSIVETLKNSKIFYWDRKLLHTRFIRISRMAISRTIASQDGNCYSKSMDQRMYM